MCSMMRAIRRGQPTSLLLVLLLGGSAGHDLPRPPPIRHSDGLLRNTRHRLDGKCPRHPWWFIASPRFWKAHGIHLRPPKERWVQGERFVLDFHVVSFCASFYLFTASICFQKVYRSTVGRASYADEIAMRSVLKLDQALKGEAFIARCALDVLGPWSSAFPPIEKNISDQSAHCLLSWLLRSG